MIPRIGKSFQLPAGGAIYFDTGVVEVATPIVELERGCCQRATRLLWVTPSRGGTFTVTLSATDLAGNFSTTSGTVTLAGH